MACQNHRFLQNTLFLRLRRAQSRLVGSDSSQVMKLFPQTTKNLKTLTTVCYKVADHTRTFHCCHTAVGQDYQRPLSRLNYHVCDLVRASAICSSVPSPRLRLMQQGLQAPHYQKHPLSRPCERQTILCAKHEISLGRITTATIIPLHPIHGRTPQPVSYSSCDDKHNKRTAVATCLKRNSCAHDQIKEWRNLEKPTLGFPLLFSASSGMRRSNPRRRSRTSRRFSICGHPLTNTFMSCNTDNAAVHPVSRGPEVMVNNLTVFRAIVGSQRCTNELWYGYEPVNLGLSDAWEIVH